MEPATRVVKVQTMSMIASTTGVSTVGGNAGLNYGGGGSYAALSRDGGWDEDDE
ncbi:MAG: hypothetical protein J5552_13300 [Prevotella sp.]|nr:hypothetical protein [Prevotella sp.]